MRGFNYRTMAARGFEQWVDHIFDHPVTDPHWAIDEDCEPEPAEVNVEYLTRLFTNSELLLRRFDNAEVKQGLWLIVDPSCSNHAFTMTQPEVPWPKRRACIRSIFDLYAKCFAARCDDGLSHCDEIPNPLNSICYMWWDLFRARPEPDDPSKADEALEYIGVMERCLTLSHLACLEGALHGLGHSHLRFPQRVEAIIERFYCERYDLPPKLLAYALDARRGCVQ
jgi:hypothetical protein